MNILIVDDEVVTLMNLEEAFSTRGHDVLTAQDAEAALEIAQRIVFDVILLDLKLPKMSGLELCRKIRPIMPGARIFAITGYPSQFEFKTCREAGFDGYFAKPLHVQKILESVNEGQKIGR